MQENLKILGKNQDFLARVCGIWATTSSHPYSLASYYGTLFWASGQDNGVSLSPSYGFTPGEADSWCLSFSQDHFCRRSVLEGMTKRTRASFPHLAPTHRAEALLQAQQAKNPGSSIVPSQLTHRAEVPWEGQVRYQLSPHCPLIEQEFHSRRNRLPSPSLALVQ